MTRKIFLIVSLQFIFSCMHAQLFSNLDLQKGFRAFDNNNYDKALQLFTGLLKSDSSGVGAYYGLAEVYFSKDYSGYNVEKAYRHILIAQNNFGELTKKQLQTLSRVNIDKEKIDLLRKQIDDELFSMTVAKNTAEGFNEFIHEYPNNANIEKARELKDQLSLYNASSGNSEDAINNFIKSNPNGKEVQKAIRIRNIVAFQNAKATNDPKALKDFIQKYPYAEEAADAMSALATIEFANAKKENTIAAYDSFLVKYPDAEEFNEATTQRNQLAYIQLLEQNQAKDKVEKQEMRGDIETQKTSINLFIAGSVILLLLAGLLFRSYKIKKRSNIAITFQKEIIEQKNKEIVDSINYAKRIQDSLLPSLGEIKKSIPDIFVYYRPRNIVSGDFYWFAQQNSRVYIAAVDCTGHGVPGAMLSMIGFNFLNQLVSELNITDPGQILDHLHSKISHTLNNDQEVHKDIRDGMDLALLCIDHAAKTISFAGAVRPLYFVDDEGIKTIKGGFYSIGGIKSLTDEFFTTYTVTPKGKATFYLVSDGYADQFGGPKGKKFKTKKFQELLLSLQSKSMEDQQKQIESTFLRWMGNNEQVDDVCVVGVRV